MAGPSILVRELHRLRRFAHELKDQIDRYPKQVQIQQNRLKKVEDALREQLEAIKKLKVAMHDKEGTVKSTNAQVRKHEEQLGGVSSKKEYDALTTEIKNERATVQQLEEQILAALAEIDERTPKLPTFDAAM